MIEKSTDALFLKNGMEVVMYNKKFFPVAIYPHFVENRTIVYSHWHEELELTCIFQGACLFYSNGMKCRKKPKGVHIVNSKEMHYALPEFGSGEKGLKGVTIQLKKDFLEELIPEFDDVVFVIPDQDIEEKISDLMYQICCKHLKATVSDRLQALSLICDLIQILYRSCCRNKAVIPINTQKDIERIRIIIKYINEHFNCELKQQELAEQFYFSREYFSRFFKEQSGLTFKEYLMRYRLEKANIELITTDHSLVEIALNNGFTDLNHYIIWFKKQFGMTPLKYRNERKSEKEKS